MGIGRKGRKAKGESGAPVQQVSSLEDLNPNSGEFSRYHDNSKSGYSKDRRRRKRRKRVLVIVIVLLLLLVGGSAFGVVAYTNMLNSNLQGDAKQAAEVKEQLESVEPGEPFYICIIGADNRPDDAGDNGRSDTCIVARVDEKNAQVTLISIPRDTAIKLDGYGTQKFNAAFSYKGPAGTIAAANQLLGINISHYAEVHFDTLVELVDTLGGIEVDVPIAFDDNEAGGQLDAGKQTINGEEALAFARSRHFYAQGDFQRAANQRQIIQAILNKIMAVPVAEMPAIADQLSKCITTDMTVQEILRMGVAFKNSMDEKKTSDSNGMTVYSCQVPSSTAEHNGISYVVANVPKLKEMMTVVDSGGDPSTVVDDGTVSSKAEADAKAGKV